MVEREDVKDAIVPYNECLPGQVRQIRKKIYLHFKKTGAETHAIYLCEIGIYFTILTTVVSLICSAWMYSHPNNSGNGSEAHPAPPPIVAPTPLPASKQPIQLDSSYRRLEELKVQAEKWMKRTNETFDSFEDIIDSVRKNDLDRLRDNDYRDAMNTLIHAEEVIRWKSIGINPQTRSKLPIYIDSKDGVDDIYVKKAIHDYLSSEFHLVDDLREAALFIAISKVNVLPIVPDPECEDIENLANGGKSNFDISIRWIGGAEKVGTLSIDGHACSGSEKDAKSKSRDNAILDAKEKLMKSLIGQN